MEHFITAAETIPHLRCRLNSLTVHSIWRMCVNVISYFDTWLVAPYFVRGSSVLIGWAAGFLTETASGLPIISDPRQNYFAAYG